MTFGYFCYGNNSIFFIIQLIYWDAELSVLRLKIQSTKYNSNFTNRFENERIQTNKQTGISGKYFKKSYYGFYISLHHCFGEIFNVQIFIYTYFFIVS